MTTEPLAPLREELETLHRAVAGLGHRGLDEYAYATMQEFVLRHGESFLWQPLPDSFEYRPQKECFSNALLVAVENDLEYVEGYASSEVLAGFPVHHAWNAERGSNIAIDTTWRIEGGDREYLGIRFPLDVVLRGHDSSGSVIDDWQDHWPLLREPWKEDCLGT